MARLHLDNLARNLFDTDIGGSGSPGRRPADSFRNESGVYYSIVEDELMKLAKGEKPYKTRENLEYKGEKLDAKIDIKYNEHRQVLDSQVTLDSEVEKDKGKMVQAYVHEITHRTFFPGDKEEGVEFRTGQALEYLKDRAEDYKVRDLARKGYREWLQRQGIADGVHDTRVSNSEYVTRHQQGQSGGKNPDNYLDLGLRIVGDISNLVESNTVIPLSRNYLGADLKSLGRYITDRIIDANAIHTKRKASKQPRQGQPPQQPPGQANPSP